MKRAIYLLMMVAGLALTSCEKDEVGGTATQSLAGEWVVTVDAVDANGGTVIEDPFGSGHIMMNTYNTAANTATEMWVDDLANFWEFKVKVKADTQALTFATEGAAQNAVYDCKVTIDEGKVLLKAATTPSGMSADSIVFYVGFDDDDNPAAYGYAKYKVSGYRYTGFAADN